MTDQQFVPLAQRYMDTVFRVAYGYLRSRSDADDVTQDVLIRLYKTDTAFENEEHLKRWISATACLFCCITTKAIPRRRSPTCCPSRRRPSARGCSAPEEN